MTQFLLVEGASMAHLGKHQPEIHGATTAVELDQICVAELDIFCTHIEDKTPAKGKQK